MLKLLIEDDEGRPTLVPLARNEISIGRQKGNTICLLERNVSRRHARILREGDGRIYVEDSSRYGSRKNGRRFRGRTAFDAGDTIQIGDYKLQLRPEAGAAAGDAATPAAAPPRRPPVPGDELKTQIMQAAPAEVPVAGMVEEPEVPELPASLQGRLVCTSPAFAGAEFRLTHEVMRIGRGDENEVVIDDESVSKSHARIVTSSAEVRIQDLDSANGLIVNGTRVTSSALRNGDVVELGSVTFQFVPAGATFVPRAAPAPAAASAAPAPARPALPGSTAAAAATPAWEDLDEPASSGGQRPAWMLPAAGLGAGAVLLGVFLMMRGGTETPAPSAAATTPAPEAAASNVDTASAAALAEGERYMNTARWEEAMTAFARVTADSEHNATARSQSALAAQEIAHRGIYEDIVNLYESGRPDDALRRINDIPSSSYYRTRVRDENLERRVLNQVVDLRIARSREEQAAGNVTAARQTVQDMMALAPDDTRLVARLAELDGGSASAAYQQRVAEATPRAEREAAPARTEREPVRAERDVARAPEPTRTEREPARAAEPARTPAAAPEPARTAARTPEPPAPAPARDASADRARADELLTEAGRLAIRRDHAGAIRLLEEAASLNPSDPRISLALHQNYDRIGNRNRAARALRRYLQQSPNVPNRAQYEAWLAENAPD